MVNLWETGDIVTLGAKARKAYWGPFAPLPQADVWKPEPASGANVLWTQSLPIWTKCQRRRQICILLSATHFSYSSHQPSFLLLVMLFLESSAFPKASSTMITLNCVHLAQTSPLSLSRVPTYLADISSLPESTVCWEHSRRTRNCGLLPPHTHAPESPPFTGWKGGWPSASSMGRELW